MPRVRPELTRHRSALPVVTRPGVQVRAVLGAALAFALLSVASGASALDCDRRLVALGDHAVEVRARCGEPAAISVREESRTEFAGRTTRGGEFGGASITVTVQVEVWLYDFGPRRFMEELTFENGILRNMRRLGYGTRAGNERRTALEPVRRERHAIERRTPVIARVRT